MANSLTFKPVLWRLFIYRLIPTYIGCIIFLLVSSMGDKSNLHFVTPSFLLILTFVISLVTLITTFSIRKSFDIVVQEGNISGPGSGTFLSRQTFPAASLDFSYRDKQSRYERISFFRIVQSQNGQKIMVADFIYGKQVTRELYKILGKDRL